MKTEVILILILTFINLSFCEEEGCWKIEGVSKKSDCTSRSLDADEKIYADSCCLVTYKDSSNKEYKECEAYLKKGVTKDAIKLYETAHQIKDLSVKCDSKWLNFSMLFIGLFALLF